MRPTTIRTASWACATALCLASPRPAPAPQDVVVRADATQLASAGVRCEKPAPGRIENLLDVAASVHAPESASWHVNSRLAGAVREVRVAPGAQVAAGDTLCVVESFWLGEAVHDYLRLQALVRAHEKALPRRREILERAVRFAEEALAHGRELADRGLNTWRELRELESALRERELERDTVLFELETRLEDQRIELESAGEHLQLVGVDVIKLGSEHGSGQESAAHAGRFEVRAPAAGVVVARGAMLGEYVDEKTELFEVRDPSTAWVIASVNERDLARVQPGGAASVTLPAFPGVSIEGRVAFVGFDLDAQTRTAHVRVEVANRAVPGSDERWPLRPGMSARARILVERAEVALALPAAAVWSDGGVEQVFVQRGPGEFVPRKVTLGRRSPAAVELLGGVAAGEEVAVDGLFFLKSMLKRGGE